MKNTLEEKRAAVYWVQRKSAEHRRSPVGASLLAIVVNVNATSLTPRGGLRFFASELAPTLVRAIAKPGHNPR
ncbi:hypothetical protein B0D71_12495 [Pseudomonas laurylsulfativorans]|uniref:Uncharacterized protein n=1 Tax=Pseudomonas laurylsulfativorans TaxID=1943631 RepID=A0A2S3VQR3_9PSED|nr:hypothetical protein B0D71_12495 [Pseudomonas laurylsulfativorans]